MHDGLFDQAVLGPGDLTAVHAKDRSNHAKHLAAVAAGRDIEYSIEEGKASCESKGLKIPVKVLKK